MKKKLFVSDLDGTLLNDDYEIPQVNKDAIQEVIKAGHIFCIATGRAWSEAKEIYESANIDTVAVTSNGSYVHSPTDCGFKAIYTPIGKEIANKILTNKWVVDNILAFNAPSKKTVTYYKVPEELTGELKYKDLEIIKTNECKVNDEVISIIMMADKDFDVDRFAEIMAPLSHLVQWKQWSVLHKGESCFIEINSKKCKMFGLEALSEYYGIAQEDIIAFGDQMNDDTMIKWAGTGIAMKNAHRDLKEMADIVLEKTNVENGVGLKMIELIKGNK